jgi:hypothetical protein
MTLTVLSAIASVFSWLQRKNAYLCQRHATAHSTQSVKVKFVARGWHFRESESRVEPPERNLTFCSIDEQARRMPPMKAEMTAIWIE